MRLRHIEIFQAIMQTGSVSGAAQLLHISQPAVTKALQHAELQLGFALFQRVKGKLVASEEAKMLEPEVAQVFESLRRVQQLAENLRQPLERPLRLLVIPTLAQYLLPQVVPLWHQRSRQPLSIATQHSREMVQKLVLQEADMGITFHPVAHPNLLMKPLLQGALRVIARPGYWTEEELQQPCSLSLLAGQPLIGFDSHDPMSGLLNSHLQQLQPPPQIQTRVQNYQLACTLVEAGQGLAIVDPFTLIGSPLPGRPLEPRISITLYALCRLEDADQPALQLWLECLTRVVKQALAPGSAQRS
ncbi:LysR substrate-binding domain-containing protein [Pokkaliibacter sp. MBI-7]|uniref:LysR family transcriptional regulator n=1 Tax=Pokkaliibacter sp. MBI-7 TaxID=3040600 RepID=UPI002447E198|nr:LysR substrate-binding domain-containing protein [Pokkaliibacter sp. MBI-7]MDH2432362.1 LysR substrate-binding domain-containing protein [Pokkaliibacter sp. MBI-7]